MKKLKCMFGRHDYVVSEFTVVEQSEMFLNALKEMIPDSRSALYKYVLSALHDKYQNHNAIGVRLCVNCGRKRYDRSLLYNKMVKAICKKIDEYEEIAYMKRVADQLKCSDCNKG